MGIPPNAMRGTLVRPYQSKGIPFSALTHARAIRAGNSMVPIAGSKTSQIEDGKH